MFRFFKHTFSSPYDSPHRPQSFPNSPFTALARNGVKALVTLALVLIALGVLCLIFPLVLAVFVALLFFMIALISLSFAWKLFHAGRRHASPTDPHVHIEIHPPTDNYQ